jgi:hypothetical protein
MRGHTLCLDAQLAVTHNPSPLAHALRAALTPGKRACTLIVEAKAAGEQTLIGQFTYQVQRQNARLAFIGPAEGLSQPNGQELLESLGRAAGERGAHHLIADVREDCGAFDALWEAGFAIYARQRLWRMADRMRSAADPPVPLWRAEMRSDYPAVQGLYHNLVPALVKQIEPPPAPNGHGLVHWQGGELLGFLEIEKGPRGVWVHPYLHPAVKKPELLLAAFITEHGSQMAKPVYLNVRSYLGWLNGGLESADFIPAGEQAVMVKRLAVALRQPAPVHRTAMEATSPEPTAPFAGRWNDEQSSSSSR